MRATLRAVFAARRMPRSTPASHSSDSIIALRRAADTGRHTPEAKLPGVFRFFGALRFGLAERLSPDFSFARLLAIHSV